MEMNNSIVSLVVTGIFAAVAAAQPCIVPESQKLLDSAGVSSHEFGHAIAASPDEIIAGSPNTGVFSFTSNGSVWTEHEIIDSQEVVTGTGFGSSLARDSDVLLVGAPLKSASGTESGTVFVFRKTPTMWTLETQLEPADPADFDHFGLSVAVAGDVAVVGARKMGPGAAYIFRYDAGSMSWTQEAKIEPSDAGPDNEFGDSVGIDAASGMVFVGAPGNSTIEQLAGAVYVFEPAGPGWTERSILRPPQGGGWNQFGFSLSVAGDVLAIGAPGEFAYPPSGSVWVYRFDGFDWVNPVQLVPTTASFGAYFGFSVVTDGLSLEVGAPYNDYPGVPHNPGSAYLYTYDGSQWVEQVEHRATDPISYHEFGMAVAFAGQLCVIGAPMDQDLAVGGGAIYLHERSCPCQWDLTGDGVLDFFDVMEFLNAFSAQNLIADLTGDGEFDFFDVAAYLDGFSGGCP